MHSAGKEMELEHVIVCRTSRVIHIVRTVVGENVKIMMTVIQIWLALAQNVLILVLVPVEHWQSVRCKSIFQSVLVQEDMQAILIMLVILRQEVSRSVLLSTTCNFTIEKIIIS